MSYHFPQGKESNLETEDQLQIPSWFPAYLSFSDSQVTFSLTRSTVTSVYSGPVNREESKRRRRRSDRVEEVGTKESFREGLLLYLSTGQNPKEGPHVSDSISDTTGCS